MQSEKNQPPVTGDVKLTFAGSQVKAFVEILQQGFHVEARLGTSIRDVVCDELGVTPEYLDHRINTIFLDGKPVDDARQAIIREESTLALSASMPGFVGAAFRKAGFYAAMRKQITHEKEEASASGKRGFFVLKLYNFVAEELGPLFLEMGIYVKADQLNSFFATRSPEFWSACTKAEIDGREVSPESLSTVARAAHNGLVRLKVLIEEAPA